MVTAAARDHDVYLVVVPVSGRLPSASVEIPGVVGMCEVPLTAAGDRSPLLELMADPLWRERLQILGVWPAEVASAPPTLANRICDWLPNVDVAAVLACRLALAPLGLALAERLGAPLMVDADDADVDYFERRGEYEDARRWDRVAALCLPAATLVTAAGAMDAAWLADRYGIAGQMAVIPNGVALPHEVTGDWPAKEGRILFVGNMTYAPNVEGVTWFVTSVLPLLSDDLTIDLIGSASAPVHALSSDRVRVHGWVPELSAWYRQAAVVVAPIWSGSGTRIKILEAFAQERPVVSTTLGCGGIAVHDGTHVLLADTPESFATAISAAHNPAISTPLVAAARRLVADTYHESTIVDSTATLFSRVTRGAAWSP
jgi:glycosyltransferase involved in cell wall biosynthesis